MENEILWKEGEVVRVDKENRPNNMKCDVLLEDDNIITVDMSKTNFNWEYTKFECEICGKKFDGKRGLKFHNKKYHEKEMNLMMEKVRRMRTMKQI